MSYTITKTPFVPVAKTGEFANPYLIGNTANSTSSGSGSTSASGTLTVKDLLATDSPDTYKVLIQKTDGTFYSHPNLKAVHNEANKVSLYADAFLGGFTQAKDVLLTDQKQSGGDTEYNILFAQPVSTNGIYTIYYTANLNGEQNKLTYNSREGIMSAKNFAGDGSRLTNLNGANISEVPNSTNATNATNASKVSVTPLNNPTPDTTTEGLISLVGVSTTDGFNLPTGNQLLRTTNRLYYDIDNGVFHVNAIEANTITAGNLVAQSSRSLQINPMITTSSSKYKIPFIFDANGQTSGISSTIQVYNPFNMDYNKDTGKFILNVPYIAGDGNALTNLSWSNIAGKPSSLSTGSAGALRISTGTGYADLGSQNNGFFHFETDRPNFYMNKNLEVDGEIRVYNSSTYLNSSAGYIAGNTIVHTGNIGSQNVNSASRAGYITPVGDQTAISGTSRHPSGLRLSGVYVNGYPFSYGNTIQMQGGLFGSELAFNCLGGGGATGTGYMMFRTQSDWGNSEWGAWKTIIDSTNIGSQSVNYASSAGSVAWGNVSGRPTVIKQTSEPNAASYADGTIWIQI